MTNSEPIEQLKEIRSLMERSSRFISLSGLSGVFAGTFALIGAYLAYARLGLEIDSLEFDQSLLSMSLNEAQELFIYLTGVAGAVLVLSVGAGLFFTIRNSNKKGLSIWDPIAKKLVINLIVPLAAGGLFCMVLLYHGIVGLVAPATLIFYGLALINASKYTHNDIWYLGFCEIVLGLIASIYIGYGLLFWAIGFGILHILYGSIMYFKYER